MILQINVFTYKYKRICTTLLSKQPMGYAPNSMLSKCIQKLHTIYVNMANKVCNLFNLLPGMHVGGCGSHIPESWQVLELDPSKCDSQVNETTVFTRYLLLDNPEGFTWPFTGVGSAQVTKMFAKPGLYCKESLFIREEMLHTVKFVLFILRNLYDSHVFLLLLMH